MAPKRKATISASSTAAASEKAAKITNEVIHEGDNSNGANVFCEAMKKFDIDKVMKEDLPIVSCVVLRASGKSEEVQLDMTPRLNTTQQILGGPITFAGQWEQLEVMLVLNDEMQEQAQKKKTNKHQLQPPFHKAKIYGDILLLKSDENGNPVDFKLQEYVAFTKLKIEEWEPEDEECSEGDDECNGDDDEEEEATAEFFKLLLVSFKKKNGREPTKKEKDSMLGALMDSMMGEDDSQDDDDDDEEEEQVVDVVPVTKKKNTAEKIAADKSIKTKTGKAKTAATIVKIATKPEARSKVSTKAKK